jgi:hypothetical protein
LSLDNIGRLHVNSDNSLGRGISTAATTTAVVDTAAPNESDAH